MTFGMEKLEWRGYPTVKNSEDMFNCFVRIHERDRHCMMTQAGVMHNIARQKSEKS